MPKKPASKGSGQQECPPAGPAETGAEEEYRCWICLADEERLDDMISPCACVGTNRYVHEACIKTYCLQYLAIHPSPELRVPCPICRSDYQIVPRGALRLDRAGWRALLRFTSTDRELLLRHCRYVLLIAPLLASTVLAWRWVYDYWEDLWERGSGPPLLADGLPAHGPPVLRGALTWMPEQLHELLQGVLQQLWQSKNVGDVLDAYADAGDATGQQKPHAAGISRNWSALYVWLQYVQWYKVLCWLLIMVIGGSDGLLPPAARDAFRIEELLLTSDARTQLFIFGQCCPFVVSKLRHFLVSWMAWAWPVQLLFYSAFTSHVEVALTLTCDTVVGAALLGDWLANVRTDLQLRLNLNRLRSGHYEVASRDHGGAGARKNS